MVGLADLRRKTTIVSIQGTDIELGGLTIGTLAKVAQEAPEIRELLFGAFAGKPVTAESMIAAAPHAVYELIAGSVIEDGDPLSGSRLSATVSAVSGLGVVDQLLLLEGVMDVSGGLAPLVEVLRRVAGGIVGEKVPATK